MDLTGWRLMVAHAGFALSALVSAFLVFLALLPIHGMIVTKSASIVQTPMVTLLFVAVVAVWVKMMMLRSMAARRMGMRHIRLPFAYTSSGV